MGRKDETPLLFTMVRAGGGPGGNSEGLVGAGSDGLNLNRQRGFGAQGRIETPTLNDMRAKQGAVVSSINS